MRKKKHPGFYELGVGPDQGPLVQTLKRMLHKKLAKTQTWAMLHLGRNL